MCTHMPSDRPVANICEDLAVCDLNDKLVARFWRGIRRFRGKQRREKMHPDEDNFGGLLCSIKLGKKAKRQKKVGHNSV